MKGFKLIAILTGKNSGTENYLKVLNKNTIYSLCNGYIYPENDFSEIIIPPQENIDLYNIDGKNISVNISAIVGMNGSGKSTLLELLFLANYNIGCELGILPGCKAKKHLDIEIFYRYDHNDYYSLLFKDSKVKISKYNVMYQIQSDISLKRTTRNDITNDNLSKFFYSIVINYSHHSLNTNDIGDWIRPLFHKNDGYQTPIVLNPMRTAGNFDINRENSLLERRLLANVLEPLGRKKEKDSLRNISNGKIAQTLKLKYKIYEPYKDLLSLLNFEKEKYRGTDIETAINVLQEQISNSNNTYNQESKVLRNLYNTIKDVYEFPIEEKDLELTVFKKNALNYIYAKIMKTAEADIYLKMKEVKGWVDFTNPEVVKAFITDSRKSSSHIFFKIKGVILYLKYFDSLLPSYKESGEFEVSVEKLSVAIEMIIAKEKEAGVFINTFMMCPPAFFETEIILSNKLSMKQLSSGEKQKIHSINSIVYHLIFLNSVEDNGAIKDKTSDKDERIAKYNNINIVLDEIELYYHPEWQRTYIHDLLKTFGLISESNSKNINGINIIISTHSPFVLSDIPQSNIIYLKDGKQVNDEVDLVTFGANIHDMLSHGFFMDEGLIGQQAKKVISELVNLLYKANMNDVESKINVISNKDKIERSIEMIGDSIVKKKLLQMFNQIVAKAPKETMKEYYTKKLKELE